jgi:hypothetical protein
MINLKWHRRKHSMTTWRQYPRKLRLKPEENQEWLQFEETASRLQILGWNICLRWPPILAGLSYKCSFILDYHRTPQTRELSTFSRPRATPMISLIMEAISASETSVTVYLAQHPSTVICILYAVKGWRLSARDYGSTGKLRICSNGFGCVVTITRALPWLRSLVADLSPRRPGFTPGSIIVGFVVDKVALGQVFLRVLRLFPVNIIPPWLSKLISSGECVIC